MWWLGIPGAAFIGAVTAAWGVQQRMLRQLAAERDRRARDAHSHRVEVAQLRDDRAALLADVVVVQAASAVIDNARRTWGAGC